MTRRSVDPSWPVARLAASFDAGAIRAACSEESFLWVYDGPPLDYWRLERLGTVFGSDYLLPFYTFPRALWIPGEPPVVNAKARFLPERERLTGRRVIPSPVRASRH